MRTSSCLAFAALLSLVASSGRVLAETHQGGVELGFGAGGVGFVFPELPAIFPVGYIVEPHIGYFLTDGIQLRATGIILGAPGVSPIGAVLGQLNYYFLPAASVTPYLGAQGGGLFLPSVSNGNSSSSSGSGETCPVPISPCPIGSGSSSQASNGSGGSDSSTLAVFGGQLGLAYFMTTKVSLDAEVDYLTFAEARGIGLFWGIFGLSYHFN